MYSSIQSERLIFLLYQQSPEGGARSSMRSKSGNENVPRRTASNSSDIGRPSNLSRYERARADTDEPIVDLTNFRAISLTVSTFFKQVIFSSHTSSRNYCFYYFCYKAFFLASVEFRLKQLLRGTTMRIRKVLKSIIRQNRCYQNNWYEISSMLLPLVKFLELSSCNCEHYQWR